MDSYDAIVVGLGAIGSATLYHLAKRRYHVLGIEQFRPNHELGSSHGDSRIIREQYFEHPLYVPLVQRAYELWRELEIESGRQLLTITSGLMIGPPDGMVVSGSLRSATTWHLAQEVLTPDDVHRRFPAFCLREDLVAVLDHRAGILDPAACNTAHLELALRAGALARYEEHVLGWIPEGSGVRVTTSLGSYVADRLLLSGGAWNQELSPDLQLSLTVERQVAFWLDPSEAMASFDMPCFPIYAYEFTPGMICYGFPRLPRGVKASIMHGGDTASTPAEINRTVSEIEVEPLRDALRPVLPELARARVLDSGVCLFTNTPDHDFIVDFHPRSPRVLISSPCSGHGFKFASVLGEIQADLLLTGSATFDISPFSLARFSPGF